MIASIPSLEDHNRNHERGGEGSSEGVSIFAGHLFGLLLGGEGPSPALTGTRRTKDGLTSPGAFGLAPSPAGGTGLPRSPSPCGLILKTGFGPRKGLASGGWRFDAKEPNCPADAHPARHLAMLMVGGIFLGDGAFGATRIAGRGRVLGRDPPAAGPSGFAKAQATMCAYPALSLGVEEFRAG
jgi:hypothetical protein